MRKPIQIIGLVTFFGAGWLCSATVHAQGFNYSHSDGCGHIFLYGWNDDRNEVLAVRADRKQLGLREGMTQLALDEARKGLEVYVDIYAKSLPTVDYCTDARMPDRERPAATLRAYAGRVTVSIGKRGTVKGRQPFTYEAEVTLRDVRFTQPDGTVLSVKGPITLKAVVGYVFG